MGAAVVLVVDVGDAVLIAVRKPREGETPCPPVLTDGSRTADGLSAIRPLADAHAGTPAALKKEHGWHRTRERGGGARAIWWEYFVRELELRGLGTEHSNVGSGVDAPGDLRRRSPRRFSFGAVARVTLVDVRRGHGERLEPRLGGGWIVDRASGSTELDGDLLGEFAAVVLDRLRRYGDTAPEALVPGRGGRCPDRRRRSCGSRRHGHKENEGGEWCAAEFECAHATHQPVTSRCR